MYKPRVRISSHVDTEGFVVTKSGAYLPEQDQRKRSSFGRRADQTMQIIDKLEIQYENKNPYQQFGTMVICVC